ncbi:hypothetical protein [Bacillus subtilis]|uniref:Uncharacterized protein n=1 Tax=Bacillus subtilis TaxID=1423 RepID=A0A1J0AKS0_BACIU|nr:hypothetical protein [Bacillus subtilis]APB62346.1 hypothetical protein pBS72_0770 [Bacillus subtilis]MEC3664971.1 hypothetical protein [Bacillus subtilis]
MKAFKTFSEWLDSKGWVSKEEHYKRMFEDCYPKSVIDKRWREIIEQYTDYLAEEIHKLDEAAYSGPPIGSTEDIAQYDRKMAEYNQKKEELRVYMTNEFNYTENDWFSLLDKALLWEL